ncbi:MAG TPA: hypothetical protein VJT73_00030 [Polyangiaceae bacterium]|nr:hypothetical protein [Polyangiaceae bacterium]
MNDTLSAVLMAKGPHPTLGRHAETYGRVIGSWKGELYDHFSGPSVQKQSVEAHFSWVLDGRAVQDVWIAPSRSERGGASALDWYGTTLRVFDPKSESWRIVWSDPVSEHRIELEGRRRGDDVVQLGLRGGRPIRWVFTEISGDAFRWQGHVLDYDGVTWRLEVDIHFRRAGQ